MKHLNLSYGVRWLFRIMLSTLVASLWAWAVHPSPNCQNFFEILIPNSQTFIADLGILFAGIYLTIKLHPVIANNILRYVFIPPQLSAISMSFFLGYFVFEVVYPDYLNMVKSYNNADLNLELLQLYYSSNKFDFWWMAIGRLLMPLFIVALPVQFLEWMTIIKDTNLFRYFFVEGKGGGGKLAGLHTFRKHKGRISYTQNNRKLILGRAMFCDHQGKPIVTMEGDSHGITAGLTGSGKETTVILNNLCQFAGSAFVVDIKGSIAQQTFRVRSSKRWLEQNNALGKTWRHKKGDARAYVLDPFNETKNLPLFNYNVCSEVDIHSERARELLFAIADGCVLPEQNDVHFSEMAKLLIAAMTGHVLSKYPNEQQNLCTVLDILSGIDPELKFSEPDRFRKVLLPNMLKDDCCGGLVQGVASKILEVGDRELGSILSTAARSLMWCGDPAMRKQLSNSDFKFSEFHERTTTVYTVLPDGLLSSQLRWLRVLISISIIHIKKDEKDKSVPTLILLDELSRLEAIETVGKGYEFYRGYGLRLWGFVQNISQVEQMFPRNFDAILGNSTVQVFGVNSLHTARFVSDMLGNAVQKTKNENGFEKESIHPLLTPAEVKIRLGKNTNQCIVFPTDGYPMRLERCSFKPQKINGKRFWEFSPFAFKGCFENY